MPSKTFIPAFKAQVGGWEYYLCLMSYAQVAREIEFAYQLGGNKDLGTMIQRGIGERTSKITDYLLTNENRFLGSLVIAAWGGHPEYMRLEMDDSSDQAVLAGVDRDFGVLVFDGTHRFFALDGQHRLRAIKDATMKDPTLNGEDIGVIVVPHFDTDKGRVATRRLFTNINKNAVKTNHQEDIALDEDDGYAILTRRFLDEHAFVGKTGVVQVFSKRGTEGELKLATRQVPVGGTAWTTIGVLYDIFRLLGFNLNGSMENTTQRATDEVLDASYDILTDRVDALLNAAGDVRSRYLSAANPKELRAPKGHEGDGHPFMRPVVQVQVAKALRQVVEQRLLTWEEALSRLSQLDWRLSAAPFSAVWTETPDAKSKGKMATGKENAELLLSLLKAHIATNTKAEIDRAVKNFKVIKGRPYPFKVDDLAGHIVTKPIEIPPANAPAGSVVEELLPSVADTAVGADVEEVADVEPGDAEDVE